MSMNKIIGVSAWWAIDLMLIAGTIFVLWCVIDSFLTRFDLHREPKEKTK
jgi:hypothetical protein